MVSGLLTDSTRELVSGMSKSQPTSPTDSTSSVVRLLLFTLLVNTQVLNSTWDAFKSMSLAVPEVTQPQLSSSQETMSPPTQVSPATSTRESPPTPFQVLQSSTPTESPSQSHHPPLQLHHLPQPSQADQPLPSGHNAVVLATLEALLVFLAALAPGSTTTTTSAYKHRVAISWS